MTALFVYTFSPGIHRLTLNIQSQEDHIDVPAHIFLLSRVEETKYVRT